MRRVFLSLSLVLVPLAGHGEDLLQVYRQARAADPVLAAADVTRRLGHEGVAQARAPLLPQASGRFAVDHVNVDGGAAADGNRAAQRSGSLSLNLSQTVFDGGRLAQLASARVQAEVQDAVYRSAEQALVVRVATAYLNVLTAEDALVHVEANEAAFRQQVEHSEQRFSQGLTALVDVEQARAFHATAQSATLGARQSVAAAREALAEITGAAPGPLRRLPGVLPVSAPSPADGQAWVAAALAGNPLLQAQQLAVEAAERNIDAARAGHWPTLSVGAGIGRSGVWPASNDTRTVSSLGLVLNVPLFAGGANESALRRALLQRDGAREELEARRRRLAREVQDQYRAVLTGLEQVEVGQRAVDAASRALESIRVGQALGTQSMRDLLLAIQTLVTAQRAHSQARHQLVLSGLLLQQAVGAVDEAALAQINGWLH